MNEAAGVGEMLDAVGEDSRLSPEEKETTVRFSKANDRATVFTAEAGLARRLLGHPLFHVDHVVTGGCERVENVEALDAAEVEIVGVKGTIPAGALKVRSSARSSSGHADVVSHTGGGA